jgi:hypothetical protein
MRINRAIMWATAAGFVLAAWIVALAIRHLHLYPQV